MNTYQLTEAQRAQLIDGYTSGDVLKYVPALKLLQSLAPVDAQPVGQSTVDFLPHDDHLRFIQRVLESDAPKSDRDDAAQMVRDLRRSIRPIAPLRELSGYVNDANILASDMPATVVQKLQADILKKAGGV